MVLADANPTLVVVVARLATPCTHAVCSHTFPAL
jgi:hypothetical protein